MDPQTELEREVRAAVENRCSHNFRPDRDCPCELISADVVRLIEAHRAPLIDVGGHPLVQEARAGWAKAQALADLSRASAEISEARAVEAEAAIARVRAGDFEAHCDCGKSYILTGEVRAALDGTEEPR